MASSETIPTSGSPASAVPMEAAEIQIELVAPILWRRTVRHRPKWVLAHCRTRIDVPVLARSDAPVIARVTPNPTLVAGDRGGPNPMIWRAGPAGPIRDVAEIRIKPDISIGRGVDDDMPEHLAHVGLRSFDGRTARFAAAYYSKTPLLAEQQVDEGIVLADRRPAMREAAERLIGAAALVDGVPHLPAHEPVWRVGRWAGDFQCTIPNSADAVERDMNNDDIDRRSEIRHVFRIDRLDEALAAARQMGERSRLTADAVGRRLRMDGVEFDRSYPWRGRELGLTLRYALRDFDRCCDEVRAAERAVWQYESGGAERGEMVAAVKVMIKALGTGRWPEFALLLKRLETIPDADYAPPDHPAPSA